MENNFIPSQIEHTSIPRKRFQPTQLFEKKRVKDPFWGDNDNSESKENFDWRLQVNIYEKSRTGFIPIGPETGYLPKSNQDSYMSIKAFCGILGQWFIGVFDGHGLNGGKVSKYIKKRLPK